MIPKLWNCQNLQRKRGIFVIICGICQSVDKKQISKWHNAMGLKKNTQMQHKNNTCTIEENDEEDETPEQIEAK